MNKAKIMGELFGSDNDDFIYNLDLKINEIMKVAIVMIVEVKMLLVLRSITVMKRRNNQRKLI